MSHTSRSHERLLNTFRKAILMWNTYWFHPAPLFNLAVCRIIVVGYQLFELTHWDHVQQFFALNTLPDSSYDPPPILRVLTLPWGWAGWASLASGAWSFRPSVDLLATIYYLTLASGVLALIGLRTNLSLGILSVGSLFIQAFLYSFHNLSHHKAILLLALCVLALSPSGGALSLDEVFRRRVLLARRRPKAYALAESDSAFGRWPLLLIQWLCALVYLSAAMHKLQASGLDWTNGYTLQYYMLQEALHWDRPWGLWLGAHHHLATVLSWTVLLFEGTFFLVLIWPRLAWGYLPLGAAIHTGIYLTMRAWFFAFLAVYAVFIPWDDVLKRVLQLLPSARRRRETQGPVRPPASCTE